MAGKEEAGHGGAQPIIVRRIKKIAGDHHGGAWKVAYADFVTAMMAFFLLLWLLNVTTDEQKSGIADYFAPTAVTLARSGSGGIFGGRTGADDGARGEAAVVVEIAPPPRANAAQATEEQQQRQRAAAEQERFDNAQAQLQRAIETNTQLAAVKENIIIDMTPEGMRIQLVDKHGGALFPSGSPAMSERTRALINQIASVIQPLPNNVSVSGHTHATPFQRADGYGNWELSADRANASRRALTAAGISQDRIAQVVGKADTDPLNAADPFQAENRRISFVLLRQVPVLPPTLR
jgi:chemotaxis protein MotB